MKSVLLNLSRVQLRKTRWKFCPSQMEITRAASRGIHFLTQLGVSTEMSSARTDKIHLKHHRKKLAELNLSNQEIPKVAKRPSSISLNHRSRTRLRHFRLSLSQM